MFSFMKVKLNELQNQQTFIAVQNFTLKSKRFEIILAIKIN